MTEMGRSLKQAAAMHDDGAVTTLARQLLNYMDRLRIIITALQGLAAALSAFSPSSRT